MHESINLQSFCFFLCVCRIITMSNKLINKGTEFYFFLRTLFLLVYIQMQELYFKYFDKNTLGKLNLKNQFNLKGATR